MAPRRSIGSFPRSCRSPGPRWRCHRKSCIRPPFVRSRSKPRKAGEKRDRLHFKKSGFVCEIGRSRGRSDIDRQHSEDAGFGKAQVEEGFFPRVAANRTWRPSFLASEERENPRVSPSSLAFTPTAHHQPGLNFQRFLQGKGILIPGGAEDVLLPLGENRFSGRKAGCRP